MPSIRRVAGTLLLLASLLSAGCATRGRGESSEETPVPMITEPAPPSDDAAPEETMGSKEGEGEVPLVVAETERKEEKPPADRLPEVLVQAPRGRHDVIRDLVAEAQSLLRDVDLPYVFTGSGKREVLRGRPVAFALWSEAKKQWTVAHVELPRPPVKWKPGRGRFPFRVLTSGIEARHEKGTGAERLMFSFTAKGEPLKVYGRKFPVFDNDLVKHKRWRDVARTAKPIVYLPFTEDTFDPGFVAGGRDYLLTTANRALDQLRKAKVASAAFPDELLADVIPAELVTTLAVIEQTDDLDYVEKRSGAFEEVLSQYGLKRDEAYRYSVSSAAALGPMQFTNRRGNGTYSLVVRRCPGARLDPLFERGATDLLNAMKAAVCLLDLELAQMPAEIRLAYHANRTVLGIFPVAAYNGGPRNVAKLYRVLNRMKVDLEDLRPAMDLSGGSPAASCPCIWRAEASGVRPVSIPKYNNENRWYIEKYQSIVSVFR